MKKLNAASLATAAIVSVAGLYALGGSAWADGGTMGQHRMGMSDDDGAWDKDHDGRKEGMNKRRDHKRKGGMGNRGGMGGGMGSGMGSGMGGGMGSGMGGENMGMKLFNRLDADGDGMVTMEEASKAKPKVSRMISRLDTDKDGEVTTAEIDAWQTKMRDRMMKRFDVNGDGTINQADQTARIEQRFARFDIDKDGKVTREEVGKVMSEWRQKRHDAMEQMRREFWGMGAE